MNEKKCPKCKILFIPVEEEKIYCSKKCREEMAQYKKEYHIKHRQINIDRAALWRKNNPPNFEKNEKRCGRCSKKFIVSAKEKVYCSRACRKGHEEYYEANKDSILNYNREYHKETNYNKFHYIKNREKYRTYEKWFAKEHPEFRKEYNIKNRVHLNAMAVKRHHRRFKTDINYKILRTVRRRLNNAIKRNTKSARTKELIGCTIEELKLHLEKQFKPGMTWENHGPKGWHIDHIIPCAAFDLSKPEDQRRCFHYTNLQPLWAEENIKKGDKYEPTD